MEYTLQLTALSGDIVSLDIVARTMALRDATAGGTPFHEPMFKGRLPGYILCLLEAVRTGRLKVCDTFGNPLTVDESIEATEHWGYATRFVNEPDWETLNKENPPVNGVQILSHIDFGPRELDTDSPNICWFTKLKWLNKWAKKRGDSFVISHEGVGWFNERGYVVGVAEQPDINQNQTISTQTPKEIADKPVSDAATAPIGSNWKQTAREIGIGLAKKHRNLNMDQIAKKVYAEMVKRKDDGASGLTGRSGRVLSAGTIRRHALYGIKTFSRAR